MVEDSRTQAETQMQTEQDGEPRKHSDGRNGESRGENREDKDAMGVKEVQEDKMKEDHGQEEKQEDEWQEEEEEEDQQEQEQNEKEKDAVESYLEEG